MNRSVCDEDIPASTLIAYWVGETPEADVLEEHVFGCANCTSRLQLIARFGAAIRRTAVSGGPAYVTTPAFIRKLREEGVKVREYRLQPGTSVACTVAPDDDLVISHLHARLGDVRQVDLVFEDPDSGMQVRMRDVAFDPAADEVVLVPDPRQLRSLGVATRRARLLAVQDGAERELGIYTFNHSPHGA